MTPWLTRRCAAAHAEHRTTDAESELVTGPTWLADSLAVVMALMAVYCASRIVTARRRGQATESDVDLVHVAMGGGMAYLLFQTPASALSRLGVIGFALAVAYFLARGAGQSLRGSRMLRGGAHHAQHALGSGAMLIMFLPVAHPTLSTLATASMPAMSGMKGGMPGMAGMAAHGAPVSLSLAAAVLGVLLLGFAGANVARLRSATPASPPQLAPRLALCCQAAMSVTMGYMLLMI
jgi:Domain of unknown function (DUF5134)